MAFFRQLQLLLWKNGLTVIRQPLWSLTLIIWPLIIFIIVAVTRNQYPPIIREACYVGPRNLPSTGFFPFLQTLMCNTDSTCHNKSRLVDPTASTTSHRSSRKKRSDSPLADLIQGNFNFSLPQDSSNDPAALIEVLNNILGSSYPGTSNNVSFINDVSTTPLENQILMELMLAKPNETMTKVGMAVLAFNQLQNQTSLWDTLLSIPKLFSSGSVDQALSTTEALLTNIQGALRVIESNFPEVGASLSTVHPVLVGGISLLRYVQNWPGKDVSIPLGDVTILQNDSLSDMVKRVLQEVQIPLDKAIALTLDKDMVRSYLCDNSSNPMWLTAACNTGTVSMLLRWISPDLVAKQALLAWSRHVASHDLSFAKGLLHSLMGGVSSGGQGRSSIMGAQGSIDTEPQNIEEELFLRVGQVVLEIIKMVPEVDMVVQNMLRTVFQSMKSATLTLDTVEEITGNVLKDVDQLKMTFRTLLTNQSQASVWASRVLGSVIEITMKTLTNESLTCLDILGPFEWLFSTKSIKIEVWRSMICQNNSALEQSLLMDWYPLVQKVRELYHTFTGQPDYNVTLPMILSEWHRLLNNSVQFGVFWEKLCTELGGAYWMNWIPQNSTDVSGILQQSCLKGTVNLLQHLYGNKYKQLARAYLKQEIKGGDVLTFSLLNLLQNLDAFVHQITMLPDKNISNPYVLMPLVSNLFESTGLKPLLVLLFNDGPLNVSTVLDVASKLGRLNQHLFTFNETDPTMAELERLIKQFFSLKSNLTVVVPHVMGHTLLTYSEYFHPDAVARFREALQPFTNQTSAGFVEAILSAMELLKKVMDSPDGDPTNNIIGYMRQLQELVLSMYRLQNIQQHVSPNGQLSTAQITDLHLVLKDFLSLLSSEGLQNLTKNGPDAAQNIVIEKFLAFIPSAAREEAGRFLRDFKALQYQVAKCAGGQNCLAGISEIFTFLDQILEMMLAANANATITVGVTKSVMGRPEYEELASVFFSLLLSSEDAAYVKTFKQALHFIRMIMATPNITVTDAQNALRQSNLTLEELNNIAALAGAANISDLIVNIMEVINARQCFEPQLNQTVTAECVMGLIDRVTSFLRRLPALHNEKAILSLIRSIITKSIGDIVPVNFSSNPNTALVHALNSTLANIKMNLQLNNLNTPEIMNEIKVLEGLIQLFANPGPLNNISMTTDPMYSQKVYLMMIQWYLKRVENITRNSSVSEILQPLIYLTHMQVTLQLAQTNFSLYVSNQIELLINSLQYPIDGAGVIKIGETTVEILQHLFEFIKSNLEFQKSMSGSASWLNATILHTAELQVKLYLDVIQKWIKQPNVTMVLTSILQWRNSNMSISTPMTDLHRLLQTMSSILGDDLLAYLSIISNISQSLNKALSVAEQPGGLQSDQFLAAIMEAVRNAMKVLSDATTPLPLAVQQNILEIVQDSLKLIVQPNMSFASSRNISLTILKRAESVIRQTVPEMYAVYLLSGIRVAITYFETISTGGGPDKWNQIILNEMKTVQSLLSPNCTSKMYISVLINITHFILESGQGNTSLWESFESASAEDLPVIIAQMGKLLNLLWPLVMGGTGSRQPPPSLKAFAHLAPVLEQLMTGKADQDTWDKLEKILKALLSTLNGTEVSDSVPSVVPQIEKIIGSMVKSMQAQNVLILSLQMPVVTLMREISQSANTSHLNLSAITERMQPSIERTLQAAQQANGTVECSEALRIWAPVREAAGLSHHAMAMWCNISLQPVFEAYNEAVNTNLNMSHMGGRPMTVNATVARIVKILHYLYQAGINQTRVTEQLVMTFTSQLSMLAGKPLSPEAKLNLYNEFQKMQLQSSSCQKLFREAAMILSANITSNHISAMMWGNFSGLTEASVPAIMREVVKLIIDMKIFGNVPMVQRALEQFLTSNDTSLIVQKLTEMSAWLASTQASGLDLLTQALPKICDILRPLLSVLSQMSVDMPANMELFEDLVGNITAMIKQILRTSGTPASMYQDLSMFQYGMTSAEIMETVHVFFANPDLNVVVKGATSNMPWGLNASREDTVDAALGVLSFLTLPGAYQMTSMDLLMNAVHMLPDAFPFASLLKNITRALASEPQENLILMQQTLQTVTELFQINPMDPRFAKLLGHLKSQVCTLENTTSVRLLLGAFSIQPGQLCHAFIPSLQALVESLNMTSLMDAIFQTTVGDPKTYHIQSDW
ncbi:ATP-binding cassette sub-family A member 12 [Collichthys lucidus]|uniref:ATP-binding cassette sub-family A member 12 n=1 Tax=Collichthys lucidus TaxID=240159 RepID=A0A4U5U0H3_COLLU|nr:ATP-binding cassette sub-family A member 12 [Collichthys lucidus]